MNDLIVKLYSKVFKSTDSLTVVEVLVLHYHYAYSEEPFHDGLMHKVGIDAPHLQDVYDSLILKKLLNSEYCVTSKGKQVINGVRIKKNTREDWFDKMWELYPVKIGKKKSKELFLGLAIDEEKFKFIYNSLTMQIKYKDFMDRSNNFYPQFKHLERWIKNEEWDNEVPDVNQTKIVNLGR
tara:strand:+ start:4191 stop:4733 length:543 start_codon:yes stop_codon:yes gene_type:complete